MSRPSQFVCLQKNNFDPKLEDGWICSHFCRVIHSETLAPVTELEDLRARAEACDQQLRTSTNSSLPARVRDSLIKEKEALDITADRLMADDSAATKFLWIFSVLVDPARAMNRVQPVYYLNMHSNKAFRRGENSLLAFDDGLIQEREDLYFERFNRKPRRFLQIKQLKLDFRHTIRGLLVGLPQNVSSSLALKFNQQLGLDNLGSAPPAQLVNLVGESGCGKSTMMAAIARSGNSRILGSFFCDANWNATHSARAFLGHVIAALCDSQRRLGQFRKIAEQRPEEILSISEHSNVEYGFRELLRVLSTCEYSESSGWCAFLVDAIDEVDSDQQGQTSILDLLNVARLHSPPWLVFVVSSTSQLRDLHGHVVSAQYSNEDVAQVIDTYVTERAKSQECSAPNEDDVDDGHLEAERFDQLIGLLKSASGSNFRYARCVTDMLKTNQVNEVDISASWASL